MSENNKYPDLDKQKNSNQEDEEKNKQNGVNTSQNSDNRNRSSSYNQEDDFILDRFPCSIEKAETHAKAKRITLPSKQDKYKDGSKHLNICECCGFKVETEEIPVCKDYRVFTFLGSGIPLYFSFVIGCIYMLIVGLVVFGIANTVFNLEGDDCIEEVINGECQKTYITQFSYANKKNDETSFTVQSYLNCVTVFILVITLHIFRRQVRLNEIIFDDLLISPSDFTVELQNLPPNITQDMIIDMLHVWWHNALLKEPEIHKYKDLDFRNQLVKKICIAYDLTEYYKLQNQKSQSHVKIRQIKHYLAKKKELPKNVTQEDYDQLLKKQDILKQDIEEMAKKVEQQHPDIKPTSVAFVSFHSQQIMEALVETQSFSWFQRFIQKIQVGCCSSKPNDVLMIESQIVKAIRAPEPSDVLWQNCGGSLAKKQFKRLMTLIVTLVVLLICFGIIYLLNKVQYDQIESLKEDNEDGKASYSQMAKEKGISFLVSFVIVFINGCLTVSIKKFANHEYRATVTHLNQSIGEKLSLAQFTNTALLTLAANYFISRDGVWHNNGLIGDVFSIIAIQAVFIPMNNYFSIFKLLRIYKRRQIKKTLERDGDACIITQGDANYWFEGNPLELANKYAHLIKIMWMVGFYAPLLPGIFIAGIVALVLTYWVDKLLLVKRYARPQLLSGDLNRAMIEKLEYFPLAMAIGNLFFLNELSPDFKTHLVDWIALGISGVNFIVPSSFINRKLCSPSYEKLQELTGNSNDSNILYDEAKKKFQIDYDRCNPITATKAITEWIQYIEKEGDENQKKQLQNYKIKNFGMASMIMKMQQNNFRAAPVNPLFHLPQFNPLGNLSAYQQQLPQYNAQPPVNPLMDVQQQNNHINNQQTVYSQQQQQSTLPQQSLAHQPPPMQTLPPQQQQFSHFHNPQQQQQYQQPPQQQQFQQVPPPNLLQQQQQQMPFQQPHPPAQPVYQNQQQYPQNNIPPQQPQQQYNQSIPYNNNYQQSGVVPMQSNNNNGMVQAQSQYYRQN